MATKTPKKPLKSGSDQKPSTRKAGAGNSSRVGTGRSLWYNSGNVDHRSQSARRYKEIIVAVAGDLGGLNSLSEIQRQLVRRHASLSLMAEKMEMSLVKDQDIDVGRFMGLTNTLGRVSAALGLSKQVLDITPKEELKRWLEDSEDEDASEKGNGK